MPIIIKLSILAVLTPILVFADQADIEAANEEQFLKNPNPATYAALSQDQKIDLLRQGMDVKYRMSSPWEHAQFGPALEFAFKAGQETLSPADQASAATRTITSLIYLDNDRARGNIDELISFANGNGTSKNEIFCEIAGEVGISDPQNHHLTIFQLDGSSREGTYLEKLESIVSWGDRGFMAVNRWLASRSDQNAIVNTDCGKLGTIRQLMSTERAKLEALRAILPRDSSSTNKSYLQSSTQNSQSQTKQKSWCSDEQIKSIMIPAISSIKGIAKTNSNTRLLFGETNGTCQLAGQLVVNKDNQFVFKMYRPPERSLELRFVHINELISLIKANQSAKPPTEPIVQKAPVQTALFQTSAPQRTTESDCGGGAMNPFGGPNSLRANCGAAK